MAHFAKLDANNIVTQVIVVSNDDTADSSGIETESIGVAFCQKLVGADTNWKQTFKDGTRKNYAGIGYKYDEARDAFIPNKFYDSWVVNEDTCQWEAPTAMPSDGKEYIWNEDTKSWDLFTPQPADE